MTAAVLSALAVAGPPDDRAVAWRGDSVLTWARFRADVGFAAAGLAARGCRRGALVCRDSYWFAVGLFALLAEGVSAVLPPNAQPGTLGALAGDCDTLVTDIAGLPGAMALEHGEGEWRTPLAAAACRLEFHTSGSTGRPKRIFRTLAELEGEVAALDRVWGTMVEGAPVVATVPHHHVYGLVFKLLWPLASGRPFACRVHDLWEGLLADSPPDAVVVSSPAHLTRLGGLGPLRPETRPRMLLSAGAPLPAEAAAEAWRVLGVPVDEVYGSTETGALATRRREEAASPWIPLPGNRIGRTGDGRLVVRSPYVADGNAVELADRVEIGADGGFHLLGRADRVAKIEGKRIGLDEVERALGALPQVADAAVIVLAGERDVLAAVVAPTPLGRAELAHMGAFRFGRHLRRALAATQEPAGLPRRWRFVEAVPAGSMGKRPASVLAALFAEDAHGR